MQGFRLSARRPGAPFHRPGSRGRRHGVRAHPRRPHLRFAPQPRRDSGQGIFRHPPVERRAAARNHGGVPRRRDSPSGGKGLRRRRAGPGASASSSTAPTARFSRAKPASIAAWAAPCTRSSLRSASIRITPSWAAPARSRPARRCTSESIASPESWSRNIGDASFGCGPVWEGITFSAMDQYRKLWDAVARRRPADRFQLHEQFLRHGRTAGGRDHGRAVHRAHRRGRQSRPDACRARQRLRSAAGDRRLPPQEADASPKAAARCCSTP